jgi:hypothetical protein
MASPEPGVDHEASEVRRMQTSETGGGATPPRKYEESVSNAIISAYYPRVAAAADAVRSRAQGASAIASVIAGGLLGAGLLFKPSEAPFSEQVLGVAALVTWLLTSALYIQAVAAPVRSVARTQLGSDAFVDAVLDNARAERGAIERRQRWARWSSFVAMALTAATALGLLLGPQPDRVPATLSLSSAGTDALGRLCSGRPTSISGMVEVASLDSRFVVVEVAAGACQGRVMELRISSEQVLGVARRR